MEKGKEKKKMRRPSIETKRSPRKTTLKSKTTEKGKKKTRMRRSNTEGKISYSTSGKTKKTRKRRFSVSSDALKLKKSYRKSWSGGKKTPDVISRVDSDPNLLKICITGAASSGKSAMVGKFIQRIFFSEYDPTINNYYKKHDFVVDEETYSLKLLDTSGEDALKTCHEQWFSWAEGFIIVYNVTDAHSFAAISSFHSEILKIKNTAEVPLLLVGTHTDLKDERQVSTNQGRDFAVFKLKCAFKEFSSATGTDNEVDSIFRNIVRRIKLNDESKPLATTLAKRSTVSDDEPSTKIAPGLRRRAKSLYFQPSKDKRNEQSPVLTSSVSMTKERAGSDSEISKHEREQAHPSKVSKLPTAHKRWGSITDCKGDSTGTVLGAMGWIVDEGQERVENPVYDTDKELLDLIYNDHNITWFVDFFQHNIHENFLGNHPDIGPFFLSFCKNYSEELKQKAWYVILATTEETRKEVFGKKQIAKMTKGKAMELLEMRQYSSYLQRCRALDLVPRLAEYESSWELIHFKIGIVFQREGQTTEDEIFSNNGYYPAYERFLSFLGTKIELSNWKGYFGGLFETGDGEFSVYCDWHGFGIMFHVSTLLPFDPKHSQQLHRKRHIGNDVTVIVFQENESCHFTPQIFTTEFNHIYFVIREEHDPKILDIAHKKELTMNFSKTITDGSGSFIFTTASKKRKEMDTLSKGSGMLHNDEKEKETEKKKKLSREDSLHSKCKRTPSVKNIPNSLATSLLGMQQEMIQLKQDAKLIEKARKRFDSNELGEEEKDITSKVKTASVRTIRLMDYLVECTITDLSLSDEESTDMDGDQEVLEVEKPKVFDKEDSFSTNELTPLDSPQTVHSTTQPLHIHDLDATAIFSYRPTETEKKETKETEKKETTRYYYHRSPAILVQQPNVTQSHKYLPLHSQRQQQPQQPQQQPQQSAQQAQQQAQQAAQQSQQQQRQRTKFFYPPPPQTKAEQEKNLQSHFAQFHGPSQSLHSSFNTYPSPPPTPNQTPGIHHITHSTSSPSLPKKPSPQPPYREPHQQTQHSIQLAPLPKLQQEQQEKTPPATRKKRQGSPRRKQSSHNKEGTTHQGQKRKKKKRRKKKTTTTISSLEDLSPSDRTIFNALFSQSSCDEILPVPLALQKLEESSMKLCHQAEVLKAQWLELMAKQEIERLELHSARVETVARYELLRDWAKERYGSQIYKRLPAPPPGCTRCVVHCLL